MFDLDGWKKYIMWEEYNQNQSQSTTIIKASTKFTHFRSGVPFSKWKRLPWPSPPIRQSDPGHRRHRIRTFLLADDWNTERVPRAHRVYGTFQCDERPNWEEVPAWRRSFPDRCEGWAPGQLDRRAWHRHLPSSGGLPWRDRIPFRVEPAPAIPFWRWVSALPRIRDYRWPVGEDCERFPEEFWKTGGR